MEVDHGTVIRTESVMTTHPFKNDILVAVVHFHVKNSVFFPFVYFSIVLFI